ncbi:hypothetical protein TNCV_3043691 [Trichonephila clavipes]|nr:hypothetical protein TNCV_3043691 [Trichonephila clavipes]
MPPPRFEYKSYGPSVSVTNHYTGWAAEVYFKLSSMPKLWRWKSVVSPSIVPSGNFAELIRTVTSEVRVVDSLVVRASDSRLEGLGSMPDATKYRVHMENVLVKSVGPKVLWADSRVQGSGEYFPPIQSHGKIVEIDGGAIYRP